LALSVYKQFEERGTAFVPQYLALLRAGGSDTPDVLARIVDCDLSDPGFWDGGLEIIDKELAAAEQAAVDAGRVKQ
jgi:oligoendopeptidase F